MEIVIGLLVPGLVWATVIAGLILVVREKAEEEDIVVFCTRSRESRSKQGCDTKACDQVVCSINSQGR